MSTSLATSSEDSFTSARTTMRPASTWSTMPSRRPTVQTPESRATVPSMPVPTSGAAVRKSGTAWRCMLLPIRARLASSFSRKGMSEAATETSWFGDTSISEMSSGRACGNSPALRQETSGVRKWPFLSKVALAWAMTCFSSSSAE